ncbi:hypothetical protein BP5796_06001 [Coleophoma crateriformis]|uniref:RING-type domain-containing protein n=1 Tax=Coleophoma crateriformis TaxID=565419 RepID=A0A3D8RVQ2_9HELO|nr:hypothetical protein BP5796_06001 [Coleophoma crateriformis]
MDIDTPGHASSSAPLRCPYNPHQIPNFTTRDAHHYDPVYNTDAWLPNGMSMGSRPGGHLHPHLPSMQNWAPAQSPWGTYGEPPNHHAPRPGDHALRGPPLAHGWVEHPTHQQVPFSYGFASNGSSSMQSTAESNHFRNSSVPSTSSPPSELPPYRGSAQHAETMRRLNRYNAVSRFSDRPPNGPTIADHQAPRQSGRSTRDYYEEQRASHFRSGRDHPRSTNTNSNENAPSRRLSFGSSDAEGTDESDEVGDHYHRNLFLDDENSLAAVRGIAAGAKRVVSQSAIATLEKVDLKELGETDRTCIICYNDFGVANPEGVTENPLRLPKCQHVFGNVCIKKWFEDSDSCPYCRDKLPSEMSRAHHTARILFARYEQQVLIRANRLQNTTRHLGDDRADDNPDLPDYPYYTSTQLERSSHYSAPHRSGQGDSPESRRRRGRLNGSRALAPIRPTSVGSRSGNQPSMMFRGVPTGIPPYSARNLYTAPRNTNQSYGSNAPVDQPPASEEISPPVAVGTSSGTADPSNTSTSPTTRPVVPWQQQALNYLQRDDESNGFSQRSQTSGTEFNPPPRVPNQSRPSAMPQNGAPTNSSENGAPQHPDPSYTSNQWMNGAANSRILQYPTRWGS